jgi:hypothetical protein
MPGESRCQFRDDCIRKKPDLHDIEGKRACISTPRHAISYSSSYGSTFGKYFIDVANECNENASSYIQPGFLCAKDTDLKRNQFVTRVNDFKVKEIEVSTVAK